MNKLFKSIISYIIIISFLYSNSVYGLPLESFSKQTFIRDSIFQQPEAVGRIEKFLSLRVLLKEGDILPMIDDLRSLFSIYLNDDQEGISVFFSKKHEERFIYNRSGIAHIYKGKKEDQDHTSLPTSPILTESGAGMTVDVYEYDKEILSRLEQVDDLELIKGIEPPYFSIEKKAEIARTKIINTLKRSGEHREEEDLKRLIDSLPDDRSALKGYLLEYWKFIDAWTEERGGDVTVTSARYARTDEELEYSKGGDKVYGWLWKKGVPGLKEYAADEAGNRKIEIDNAIIIRDYIFGDENRGELLVNQETKIRFLGYKGDKDLNDILTENLQELFSGLSKTERDELFDNLKKYVDKREIAVAILDSSRHWCENCRGDRFIGVNRYLLEKIRDARKNVDKRALKAYLQTYLYHELRHEAFMEEKKLISKMACEVRVLHGKAKGLPKDIHIEELDTSTLLDLIKSLDVKARKIFEEELERRQNGLDAKRFARIAQRTGISYEKMLDRLKKMNILKKKDNDLLFYEAAAVAGFAQEIYTETTDFIHINELKNKDFHKYAKGKIAGRVFSKYAEEYDELKKQDRNGTMQKYRGKVSYLYYKLGLTNELRVSDWRKWPKDTVLRQRERELAKEYIIRLIDFLSTHYRATEDVLGRGEVSVFKRRDEPVGFKQAAKELTVKLLETGDYGQAIRRTELAFRTSGLIGTVSGNNRYEFWKLVQEACEERAENGDKRYAGIDIETLRYASIENEVLPSLRILYVFREYLSGLPEPEFFGSEKAFKKNLGDFCDKYDKYLDRKVVNFETNEIERFFKLYNEARDILARAFRVHEDGWEEIFNVKEEDLLFALWNTFDFIENLTENIGSCFSEPLLAEGDAGREEEDRRRFSKKEIEGIKKLKDIFYKDREQINAADITREENILLVQMVLRIYKAKTQRYRRRLNKVFNRYSTVSDINGKRVCELVKDTRAWASAIWLAKMYGGCIEGGEISKAIDLDSGLSLFFRALRALNVSEDKLSGLFDFIGEGPAEYFGDNPNRARYDIAGGVYKDIQTGRALEIKNGAYQLITSIYKFNKADSANGLFLIFKKAHQLLNYGGHFAITLPQTRFFTGESLKFLEEKMGFKAVFDGVTGNELSEATRDRLRNDYDKDEVEKKLEEISKRKFYVVIFSKVPVKSKEHVTTEEKRLLRPKKTAYEVEAKVVRPDEAGPDEAQTVKRRTVRIDIDDGEFAPSEVRGDAVAENLREGLENSDVMRKQAEREVSKYQLDIKALLETKMYLSYKLEDYVKGDLKVRADKALGYSDEDYTEGLADELLKTFFDLDEFRKFIDKNAEDFADKLKTLGEKSGLIKKLRKEHEHKEVIAQYDKVTKYKDTDLDKETLKEVAGVYDKITGIEQNQEKQKKDEEECRRLIAENKEYFKKMKKLIKKYKNTLPGLRKKADKVLKGDIEKLTKDLKRLNELLALTKEVDGKLAKKLSVGEKEYRSLADFEAEMTQLFESLKEWCDVELLFTASDMEFLTLAMEQWEVEEVDTGKKNSIFYRKSSAGLERLIGCMCFVKEWIEDWEIWKDDLDWDTGLASLLKEDMEEREYINEILCRLFMREKDISGKTLGIGIDSSGDEIKKSLTDKNNEMSVGERLIISINDRMYYSEEFLKALEKSGFQAESMFEVSVAGLKYTAKDEQSKTQVQEYLDRGRRIIVVKKKDKAGEVSADELSFSRDIESQKDKSKYSYKNRMDIILTILQYIIPEDVNLSIKELLNEDMIRSQYPEWAGRILGDIKKNRLKGGFYYKKDVEELVESYKKQQKKKARKKDKKKQKKKRKDDLITKAEKPLVRIPYDKKLWTESTVKDLAHILDKLIIDFENPPEINYLAGHPSVINHPQLGKIAGEKRERLCEMIKILIEYRKYDLQVERVYRGFGQAMDFLLPGTKSFQYCYVYTHRRKRVMDLVNINRAGDDSTIYWHEYGLGIDESPFGSDSPEGYFNEVVGKILELRHFMSEEFIKVCPPMLRSKKKALFMHYLRDTEGFLKEFNDIVYTGVTPGIDSFIAEERVIDEIGKNEPGRELEEVLKNLKKLFTKARSLLKLVSEIYTNKNIDVQYLGDFESSMHVFADNMLRDKMETGEIIDNLSSIIDGFTKLFSGRMRKPEYERFKKETAKKLKTEKLAKVDERIVIIPSTEDAKKIDIYILTRDEEKTMESGRDSFDYYVYDEKGQKRKVNVNVGDYILKNLLSEDEEGDIDLESIEDLEIEDIGDVEAGSFYEALDYLKLFRLYEISNEERKEIDELTERALLSGKEAESEKYIEQIKAYLMTRNTVNRWLYFEFVYLDKAWRHEPKEESNEKLDDIRNGLIRVEPKLKVYAGDVGELGLIALLIELYRLKQMMEDPGFGEIAFAIQMEYIRILEIIGEKIGTDEKLQYYLAIPGIPYHKDLLLDINIGISYSRRIEECQIMEMLEVARKREFKKRLEDILKKINLFHIYFPDSTKISLQNIARAIGNINLGFDKKLEKRIETFLDRLAKIYGEEQIEYLNGLIGRGRREKGTYLESAYELYGKSFSNLEDWVGLSCSRDIVDDDEQNGTRVLIGGDQGVRIMFLDFINNGEGSRKPERQSKNVGYIMSCIQSPYEIYYAWKRMLSAERSKNVYLNPVVIESMIEKLVEFIDKDKGKAHKKKKKQKESKALQVIDILTNTYNQYLSMRYFVKLALNHSERFRDFIAELFTSEDPVVSSFAYLYLEFYIEDYDEAEQQGLSIQRSSDYAMHNIFSSLLEKILAKGSEPDGAKLRMVLELFGKVVTERPDFTLKEEWERILEKYKEGQINEETLRSIGRNANWQMEEVCKEIEGIEDIENRFALTDEGGNDVFEEAVKKNEPGGKVPLLIIDLGLAVFFGLIAFAIAWFIYSPTGFFAGGVWIFAKRLFLILFALSSPWWSHEVLGHYVSGKILTKSFKRWRGFGEVDVKFQGLWTEVREKYYSMEKDREIQEGEFKSTRKWIAALGPAWNFLVLIVAGSYIFFSFVGPIYPLYITLLWYTAVSNLIAGAASLIPVGTFPLRLMPSLGKVISWLRWRLDGRQSDGGVISGKEILDKEGVLLKDKIRNMLKYDSKRDFFAALSGDRLFLELQNNYLYLTKKFLAEIFDELCREDEIITLPNSEVLVFEKDLEIIVEKFKRDIIAMLEYDEGKGYLPALTMKKLWKKLVKEKECLYLSWDFFRDIIDKLRAEAEVIMLPCPKGKGPLICIKDIKSLRERGEIEEINLVVKGAKHSPDIATYILGRDKEEALRGGEIFEVFTFTEARDKKGLNVTRICLTEGQYNKISGEIAEFSAGGETLRMYKELLYKLSPESKNVPESYEEMKEVIEYCLATGKIDEFLNVANAIMVFKILPQKLKKVLKNDHMFVAKALLWSLIPEEKRRINDNNDKELNALVNILNEYKELNFNLSDDIIYGLYFEFIKRFIGDNPKAAVLLFSVKLSKLLSPEIFTEELDLKCLNNLHQEVMYVYKPLFKLDEDINAELSPKKIDVIFHNVMPEGYERIEQKRDIYVNGVLKGLYEGFPAEFMAKGKVTRKRAKRRAAGKEAVTIRTQNQELLQKMYSVFSNLLKEKLQNKLNNPGFRDKLKEELDIQCDGQRYSRIMDGIMKKIKITVASRIKHNFSIFEKMARYEKWSDEWKRINGLDPDKPVGVEDLPDLLAFRIIVDDKGGVREKDILTEAEKEIVCHAIYEILREDRDCGFFEWNDRSQDYITYPKPNGYKSINSIWDYSDKVFEVQIRTKKMHEEAETGSARHDLYSVTRQKGEALELGDTVVVVYKEKDKDGKCRHKLVRLPYNPDKGISSTILDLLCHPYIDSATRAGRERIIFSLSKNEELFFNSGIIPWDIIGCEFGEKRSYPIAEKSARDSFFARSRLFTKTLNPRDKWLEGLKLLIEKLESDPERAYIAENLRTDTDSDLSSLEDIFLNLLFKVGLIKAAIDKGFTTLREKRNFQENRGWVNWNYGEGLEHYIVAAEEFLSALFYEYGRKKIVPVEEILPYIGGWKEGLKIILKKVGVAVEEVQGILNKKAHIDQELLEAIQAKCPEGIDLAGGLRRGLIEYGLVRPGASEMFLEAVFCGVVPVEEVVALMSKEDEEEGRAQQEDEAKFFETISAEINLETVVLDNIVSIGGNSLLTGEDVGDCRPKVEEDYGKIKEAQKGRIKETLRRILPLIENGGVITHGNGPEVGVKLERRRKKAQHLKSLLSQLADVVKETQEWIAEDIIEALGELGIDEERIEFIYTHVGVSPNDPGFDNPTKPIGIKPKRGKDTRPLVASPEPLKIIEIDKIKEAVQKGKIVICVGGGGIPIDYDYFLKTGNFKYLPAVIDKDLATVKLVKELAGRDPPATVKTKRLIISTDLPCAFLNFGDPKKIPIPIKVATPELLEQYIKDGHFAEGSMLPKIEAALAAIKSGSAEEVIITNPENISKIDEGGLCTRIVRKMTDREEKVEYISDRLVEVVEAVTDVKRRDILKGKLQRLLWRVQGGKRIELTELQVHRLLWLIDRSREINLVDEIALLIDLLLESNYSGDPGEVVMAVEKEILAWLYTEQQVEEKEVRRRIEEIYKEEEGKLLVRTLKGFRFKSGVDIPGNVKNTIRYVEKYKLEETVATKKPYYVLIDEYRAEKYEKLIEKIEGCGVKFVTELPQGVRPEEVVVLIDPEDADYKQWKGFKWYLPLIYTEKSFILAAWLSINKPDEIEDLYGTPVYEFVKGFYENLLGRELDGDDVINWFNYPWLLKDRLKTMEDFARELKLLRIAFEEIDRYV